MIENALDIWLSKWSADRYLLRNVDYIMFLGGFVGVAAIFSLFRDICESFFYIAASDAIHRKAFKVLPFPYQFKSGRPFSLIVYVGSHEGDHVLL